MATVFSLPGDALPLIMMMESKSAEWCWVKGGVTWFQVSMRRWVCPKKMVGGMVSCIVAIND